MATKICAAFAILALGGVQAAHAAEWRYCLARSLPQNSVYMSAIFSSNEMLGTLEAAFDDALDHARIPHDHAQCPRGEASSIETLKNDAIRFNRLEGKTIVEFHWTRLGGARS